MNIIEEITDYPITVSTVLAAVLATLAYWNDVNVEHLFMSSDEFLTQPWRLLTSGLLHADALHLIFNVYWVWTFGRALEARIGKWQTACWFVLLLASSSAAEFALFRGGIGLSGLGYGLFGMLWVLSRRDPRYRGVVSDDVRNLFVLWFFLCLILSVAGTWNVANVAHGSGALVGFLVGNMLSARPGRHGRRRLELASCVGMIFLLATIGREYVNLGA
jgi:membrane associated rhomboid family serine protease